MHLSIRTLVGGLESPRMRLARRIAVMLAVTIGGAWLGLLLGGHVTAEVGPVDVRLSLRPSLTGDALIDVAPLGTLSLDSHDGPVQLIAQVEQVRPDDVSRIIEDPRSLHSLGEEITANLRTALTALVMKSTMSAVVGAAALGLVVFRRPSRAGFSVLTCCALSAVTVAAGAATYDPRSISEPRYTGLLASAPSVVGSAESIVTNFSQYSDQLAALVTNVSRLYEATSTLPVYQPDPATVRVLHVSDIHLNPAAWHVIRSVSEQFQVDVIVDSGDITDHGSRAENAFVEEISSLDVPYVFVRGNHDSESTAEAIADQEGAVVLDGEVREVADLRFFGAGDPRFTPDKSTRASPGTEGLLAEGRRLAAQLRSETGGETDGDAAPPADMAVLHDPNEGRAFDGLAPLVLSGHAHARSTEVLQHGTRLFVQGSTGGAGLRGLDHEEPTPVTCTVFYFDRTTGRLQAWDDITLGGIGLSSANIERHVEPEPNRVLQPPSPVPTTTEVSPGSLPGRATFGQTPTPTPAGTSPGGR